MSLASGLYSLLFQIENTFPSDIVFCVYLGGDVAAAEAAGIFRNGNLNDFIFMKSQSLG